MKFTLLENLFVSVPVAAAFLFGAKTTQQPDASAPLRRGERFSLSWRSSDSGYGG